MSVNKISNSAASAIQAYKDKLAVEEKSKVQSQQTDKSNQNQAKVEKDAAEANSTKVTLTSQKLAKELMETQATENTHAQKVDAVNRQSRLDEIAKQIQNNTYKVNSEAVANKMLQDKGMVKYLLGM